MNLPPINSTEPGPEYYDELIENQLKFYRENFKVDVKTVEDVEQDVETTNDGDQKQYKMNHLNAMFNFRSAGMAAARSGAASADTASNAVPSQTRQTMKVDIPTTKMKEAIKALPDKLQKKFKTNGNKTFSLDVADAPRELLENLVSNPAGLAMAQIQVIAKALGEALQIGEDTDIDSITKLHTALLSLSPVEGYNFEVECMGRWYPTTLTVSLQSSWMGKFLRMQGNLVFSQDLYTNVWETFWADDFIDENDHRITRKLGDLLKESGLRIVRKETVAEMRKLTTQAVKTSEMAGTQMLLSGPGFVQGFFGPREIRLGTPDAKVRVVVEPNLGIEDGRNQNPPNLPFVRVFDLGTKQYAAVDVRELSEYTWDENAINKLTLPDDLGDVVKTVFVSSNKGLFGDVLSNRHGGMIILANGGPGVGKTLTAEVFAEHTKRPLYVMEIGELGTNVNDMENRLQQIFERVQKWNAVLLFDEADIYLHKRGEDLEHNAVVGIFLRLMDYYKGLLFMTTNRGDIIDPAFASRITLRLNYPNLDEAARTRVWETMFKSAGLTLLSDLSQGGQVTPGDFKELASDELNGRQIRNVVRLVKVVHANGQVKVSQVRKLMKFSPARSS